MSAFRKAKKEQAALKMGIYGLAGSGKTFTALLMAEGLAKISGKRIAFLDTERGTDFYCVPVKERQSHPEAFDFDALYTRSITETLSAVKGLSPNEYSVVVIDSITHLWEAVRNAYSGKLTKAGTIPFHAWGSIKKPYKELITYLLNSPLHVIICGRQGNEFQEDPETEELKRVGVKMKAEGETPYEPHILINMEAVKTPKSKVAIITAYAEKDRTGILAGRTIEWPKFDNMIKPLLPYLKGDHQAHMSSSDEVGGQDAERLAEEEKLKIKGSEKLLGEYQARIKLCNSLEELKNIGKELTPEFKKQFVQADIASLRESYLEKEQIWKPINISSPAPSEEPITTGTPEKKQRKERSDKGTHRKEAVLKPHEEQYVKGVITELEEHPITPEVPEFIPEPTYPKRETQESLINPEMMEEIKISCQRLGLNPDRLAAQFREDKGDGYKQMTKSEADKMLNYLLDTIAGQEK